MKAASPAPFEAIVVGSTDVAESSRVVRLLTADAGLLPVFVGQARASRRRYGGALEPGTRLRVTVTSGRGSLPNLHTADVLAPVRRPRDDLRRAAWLWYGCEVCAKLSAEHHENERMFRLLVAWLDLVEAATGPTVASRVALEAKALTFAGLAPALTRCTRCDAPLDDPMMWSHEAGGALHARCGGGAPILLSELTTIESLRRTPLVDTPSRGCSEVAARRLTAFVEHQLGAPLQSRALLDDIAGGPGPG